MIPTLFAGCSRRTAMLANVRFLLALAGLAVAAGGGALDACAADPPAKGSTAAATHAHGHAHAPEIEFTLRSARNGGWSEPATWEPQRAPKAGDRILVSAGTTVLYDAASDDVIRLVQVVGTLRFARDRDTLLNVAVLKVQNSNACSESGFACDLVHVNRAGEPLQAAAGTTPTLEVGTLAEPIPAQFTARIRLHYLEGMNKEDAPALVCCAARMDLHGAPLSRTWVKLGADAAVGERNIRLAEAVSGWRVGDEVLFTAGKHPTRRGTFRGRETGSEVRTIAAIEGEQLTLNEPLTHAHPGSGEFRSEVANLSRNVVIESADPDGVRGHTMYHRHSQGGISYARFAHLGKEGLLGKYAIHFHLVGDTMRGSQVLGASVVDSHNRWVTVHGTEFLIVRDCVGYKSVGHGYFLEDGTEAFNLIDRNLGVQAYRGKRLPEQVLPFDPNDGGAFWWSNGHNAFTRNVACENDEYGFRYDSQKRSNFDSDLNVRTPAGQKEVVDIRTLPIYSFRQNETHSEGLYGVALAGTDGAGPDTRHPHYLRDLKIWEVHYALRAQLPTMWVENVNIERVAYGVYRPWFENHVYRNLRICQAGAEPFNRGQDDDSEQHGRITVDGLKFEGGPYGSSMPLIQISDNNLSGGAESHFRNVSTEVGSRSRAPLVNLGGGTRRQPKTEKNVPVYLHDYFGPGKHAVVVSTRSKEYQREPDRFREVAGLTGDESRATEISQLEFPQLLTPTDDLPPVTVITSMTAQGNQLQIRGVTHDNREVDAVEVNGQLAQIGSQDAGVADWTVTIAVPKNGVITAQGTDQAGNREANPHRVVWGG